MNTVIVAGATGLVGRECVKLMLVDAEVRAVHALVRCKTETRHLKYLDHLVDWRHLENGRVVGKNGLDSAICCLGTTMKSAGSQAAFKQVDLDYVLAFAHFAKARGAQAFALVSAAGADPKSSLFYNRVKGEAEAAVRALGFESVTIVRPSFLIGERAENRPGERFAIAAMNLFKPLVPAKYRPIAASAVAQALVRGVLEKASGVSVIESDALQRLPTRS
jgi:uncharacterized protein YbjT (DUF2867 family)